MLYVLAMSSQQGPAFWEPSLQLAQRSSDEELGSDHASQLVLQCFLVARGGSLGDAALLLRPLLTQREHTS